MDTGKLDRNSTTPLYQQLKKLLTQYIIDNLKPGDTLPVESEIEKRYEVSRITVRKTIDELVAEGIVVRQQGRGTFVKSTKIVQDAGKITSWTEEMRRKGKKPETRRLDIREIAPSNKLSDSLNLKKGETVISIKRIRYADGEPIAIMVNYLPSKVIPGFLQRGLHEESLYEVLEKEYEIVIEEANELIRAREATELEALELGAPPYSAVLHITRNSFFNGKPIEVVEMVSRSDKYEYYIQLSANKKSRLLFPTEEEL